MKKKDSKEELFIDSAKPKKKVDTTKLSVEVLRIMVEAAAAEAPGIFGMSGRMVDEIAEKLGRKDFTKGIKVILDGDDVAIELAVIVEYGHNIAEACNNLNKLVKETIEKTTKLNVSEIVIHVHDVCLPEDKEKGPDSCQKED